MKTIEELQQEIREREDRMAVILCDMIAQIAAPHIATLEEQHRGHLNVTEGRGQNRRTIHLQRRGPDLRVRIEVGNSSDPFSGMVANFTQKDDSGKWIVVSRLQDAAAVLQEWQRSVEEEKAAQGTQ